MNIYLYITVLYWSLWSRWASQFFIDVTGYILAFSKWSQQIDRDRLYMRHEVSIVPRLSVNNLGNYRLFLISLSPPSYSSFSSILSVPPTFFIKSNCYNDRKYHWKRQGAGQNHWRHCYDYRAHDYRGRGQGAFVQKVEEAACLFWTVQSASSWEAPYVSGAPPSPQSGYWGDG